MGSAFEVSQAVGAGFLEKVYERQCCGSSRCAE